MPQLRNSISIDALPDDVWAILGDLTATPAWIPGIVSAEVDGLQRRCQTADGHEIREVISDYSAGDRAFRYTQLLVPLPIRDSRGTLAVWAEGDASRLVWDAEFEVLDREHEAAVTGMIQGYYQQTLDNLKRVVESRRLTA